jgi:hypothetical protein
VFPTQAASLDTTILRPRRNDEKGRRPHLAPIRQRVESIFWTFKDLLTLERHGARTLHGLRAWIASHLVTLASAIAFNHHLARSSRQLADLVAEPVELLI